MTIRLEMQIPWPLLEVCPTSSRSETQRDVFLAHDAVVAIRNGGWEQRVGVFSPAMQMWKWFVLGEIVGPFLRC